MAITENSIPPLVALAGNELEFNFSTSEHAQDFIGIHCQLQTYDGASWNDVGIEKRLTPDDNHEVVFDPSSLLDWEPEKEFTLEESVTSFLVKRNDLRKIYRVTRSEKYGNPLSEYNSGNTSLRYVLPGGISKIRKGQINEDSSTWYAWLTANKKFLSNSPAVKTVDPLSRERLFFFVYGSFAGLYLKMKIEYTDGTDQTVDLDNASCSAYDVFELIVSPSAVMADYYHQSKTVKQYSIYLVEDDEDTISSAITEVKTYKMDRVPAPNSQYFFFTNSHRMTEGLRFTGMRTGEAEYGGEVIDLNETSDSETDDPLIKKINTVESLSFAINSGWVDKDELILYREFFNSKQVCWMVNDMTVPVIVTPGGMSIHEDNQEKYNLTVEFSLAHKDEFLSDDLIPEEVSSTDQLGSETMSNTYQYPTNPVNTFSKDYAEITSVIVNDGSGGFVVSNTIADPGETRWYFARININLVSGSLVMYAEYADSETDQFTLEDGINDIFIRIKSGYTLTLRIGNNSTNFEFNTVGALSMKKLNNEFMRAYIRENNY